MFGDGEINTEQDGAEKYERDWGELYFRLVCKLFVLVLMDVSWGSIGGQLSSYSRSCVGDFAGHCSLESGEYCCFRWLGFGFRAERCEGS